MKKPIQTLVLTVILFTVFSFIASAQAQFSGGLHGGANLAMEQYPGFTMKGALLTYGGAFARLQVSQLAFQLEANYSAEGGNLKAALNGGTNKYRETYLDVPLFIQGRFPSGMYIEFGPQYGILSSSTYNFNNTGDVNTRAAYKSYNFSVGGGLGYEFQKQGLKGLGIGLRFMQGLTAISSSGYGDIITSAVSLGISERF